MPPKKNLKLSAVRRSRNFAHHLRAAFGGENGSDYLYYPAKNELAVSFGGRKFLVKGVRKRATAEMPIFCCPAKDEIHR